MTTAQTEARASLWAPATADQSVSGWTYDFDQIERISRAAYNGTGYDATMEVVQFVMAEADRRYITALAAKDAETSALKKQVEELTAERDEEAKCVDYAEKDFLKAIARAESAEAEAAALRKVLEFYADVSKYPAPLTGGMGDLWADCGRIARAALEAAGGRR